MVEHKTKASKTVSKSMKLSRRRRMIDLDQYGKSGIMKRKLPRNTKANDTNMTNFSTGKESFGFTMRTWKNYTAITLAEKNLLKGIQ